MYFQYSGIGIVNSSNNTSGSLLYLRSKSEYFGAIGTFRITSSTFFVSEWYRKELLTIWNQKIYAHFGEKLLIETYQYLSIKEELIDKFTCLN